MSQPTSAAPALGSLPQQWREKWEAVANELAKWINDTPLPPRDIHPVYNAHVLLCSLVEREQARDAALTRLRGQLGELEQVIPTNWTDPLLTGPSGIGQPPYSCTDIEELLNALRGKLSDALRDLHATLTPPNTDT